MESAPMDTVVMKQYITITNLTKRWIFVVLDEQLHRLTVIINFVLYINILDDDDEFHCVLSAVRTIAVW